MDINREIEALKQDFDKYDHDFLVSKWVVERLPYIFKDNYEEYLQIKIELAKLLNVDSCSIIFVGSSCTGFSLSPYKSFKEFGCAGYHCGREPVGQRRVGVCGN